jgi:peptidylamidoglycolate lyase
MEKRRVVLTTSALGLIVMFVLGGRMLISVGAQSRAAQVPDSIAAVAGQKGGQDIFGAYEPVANWPQDLSELPGNEKWTWGSVEGVFAESPDRVFIFQRGELPNIPVPKTRRTPEFGPSLAFPVGEGRVPMRNATTASPPANGGTGQLAEDGLRLYTGRFGVDALWEHNLVIVDANGKMVESWMQWDSMWKRPHSVFISPYDPAKNVWLVDDHQHAIFKFTNDGKRLLQTIGTPGVPGADATHFNRPTFIVWLPDGTFFVSDGYNGTRVAKFDKTGKFLLDWGQKGVAVGNGTAPPWDTRPGYFNNVHGIAIDPDSRRVFVNDRSNKRIQVFDENGKHLDEWSIGPEPAQIYTIYMGADHFLWGADYGTSKMVKWDEQGHLLYTWGTFGHYPGGMWGVHQISVDQEGNLYVSEVNNGRAQKFRPRPGANPAFLVGKPVYSAWK